MPTPGNSINEATTGICGFTGTAFTGTPVTNHAVIVGAATSSTLTNVGPSATAGQILQSAGASADPAFSTATYPSTAGTSGNVLTSNGTNFTSAAPATLSVSGHITSAQVKALHGTPVQLIASPGANKMIVPVVVELIFNYAGTNAFTNGGTVGLFWGTTPAFTSALLGNAAMIGTASAAATGTGGSGTIQTSTAVNIYNSSATEFAGNAANDNTVSYYVTYFIMDLTA